MPARGRLGHEVLDYEGFSQFGPGLDGGLDEDLVERRSARSVAERDPVDHQVGADQREIPEYPCSVVIGGQPVATTDRAGPSDAGTAGRGGG